MTPLLNSIIPLNQSTAMAADAPLRCTSLLLHFRHHCHQYCLCSCTQWSPFLPLPLLLPLSLVVDGCLLLTPAVVIVVCAAISTVATAANAVSTSAATTTTVSLAPAAAANLSATDVSVCCRCRHGFHQCRHRCCLVSAPMPQLFPPAPQFPSPLLPLAVLPCASRGRWQ